jgi:integrase
MERRVLKLTRRRIELEREALLAGGEGGQRILWDSDIPGFGIRVTKTGAAAFPAPPPFVDYRDLARVKRRCAIGKVIPAEVTVEHARKRAATIKVDVRGGRDPVGERREAATAARRQESRVTVAEAIGDWLAAGEWSPITRQVYAGAMARDVTPYIGQLALADLNRLTLMAQVSRVKVRSKSTGAALFRQLSSFLGYLEDHGLTDGLTLPKGRKVAKAPEPRSRFPNDARLVEIWQATDRRLPHSCVMARMVILTAQRRRTVEGMQWNEIDFDEGRWSIPGERMKNGEPHEVALGRLAIAELSGLRRLGPYVFTANKRPPSRLGSIALAMQAEVGGGWSFHDFRRALMTWAVSHGHPREFAKIALGHTVKDRLDRAYDQHDYRPEAARIMLG